MHFARALFILVILAFSCTVCIAQQSYCEHKQTCTKCIGNAKCAWCKDVNFEMEHHCVDGAKVHALCSPQHVVDPQTRETSREGDGDQFQPHVVHVNLRPGQTYKFNFTFTQANFPVDLYYLMDLSASMDVHRDKLSKLGSELTETMKALTQDFKLGFGSFVDKIALPFVNTAPSKLQNPCNSKDRRCTPAYGFRNHLSLTDNDKLFSKKVRDTPPSGNIDLPEGGLDAIMQAIVCDEIGWRRGTRRLLIFSTDDVYHVAGDGKLAGIVRPNDGLCHMHRGNYTHSLLQDYPSIGQINAAVIKYNVIIIFAVDKTQQTVYTKLKNNIKGAEIGILSTDSANVVDLVKGIYSNISSSVKLFHDFPPNEFTVTMHSTCSDGLHRETKECKNLRDGSVTTFEASITLEKCPSEGPYTKHYYIKVEGLSKNLTIVANMLCTCDCEHPSDLGYERHSEKCSRTGDLQCGICKCDPSRSGQTCQCDREAAQQNDNIDSCRPNRTVELCSGVGECKCGMCICNKRANPKEKISGKYCECDNYSCQRRDNKLCSGSSRGECVCGKCECLDGWSGEACDCSTSQEECIPAEGAAVCSGHGDCVCGRCQCTRNHNQRYAGTYCEDCLSCREQKCEEFRNCVECRVHETGNYTKDLCENNCRDYAIDVVEEQDDSDQWICSYLADDGCTFKFNFSYDASDELHLVANKNKQCPREIDKASLATGIIASILLPILIGLIMWKVCVTYRDSREYKNFLLEQKLVKWEENESPLFIDPISTYSNPTYRK